VSRQCNGVAVWLGVACVGALVAVPSAGTTSLSLEVSPGTGTPASLDQSGPSAARGQHDNMSQH